MNQHDERQQPGPGPAGGTDRPHEPPLEAGRKREPGEHQDPDQDSGGADPVPEPDPRAGLAREVGDLEDPEAEDDGALPGRVGGGLAGG